jgi:hypothetical protein
VQSGFTSVGPGSWDLENSKRRRSVLWLIGSVLGSVQIWSGALHGFLMTSPHKFETARRAKASVKIGLDQGR